MTMKAHQPPSARSWASASASWIAQESALAITELFQPCACGKDDFARNPPDRANWSWRLAPLFGPAMQELGTQADGQNTIARRQGTARASHPSLSLVVRSFCLRHRRMALGSALREVADSVHFMRWQGLPWKSAMKPQGKQKMSGEGLSGTSSDHGVNRRRSPAPRWRTVWNCRAGSESVIPG